MRSIPALARRIPLLLPLLIVAGLILAACQAGASASPAATASPAAPSSALPAGSGAALSIEIKLTDALRFEPAAIAVKAGAPIHFVITNTGTTDHEFYIGDEAAQDEHGKEMAAGGMMHDEPNGVSVPAGESKTLDFTFAEAGETLIGCHTAGHYEAGMKVSVTVEP